MARLEHIYIVGTPAEGDYASLGRSWEDPSYIRAFARIDEAVFAEATGDVCIPGYFAGEEDPMPMSSSTPAEVVAALRDAGISKHLEIYEGEDEYDGEIWMSAKTTNLWVERLPADKAQALRTIFDRHADPAIVGRRSIYQVEVK